MKRRRRTRIVERGWPWSRRGDEQSLYVLFARSSSHTVADFSPRLDMDVVSPSLAGVTSAGCSLTLFSFAALCLDAVSSPSFVLYTPLESTLSFVCKPFSFRNGARRPRFYCPATQAADLNRAPSVVVAFPLLTLPTSL